MNNCVELKYYIIPRKTYWKVPLSYDLSMGSQIDSLHTENYFLNLAKSPRNQIVYTLFRSIWIGLPLDANQSKNGKYNLILGWFNKIQKRFICMYIQRDSQEFYFIQFRWNFSKLPECSDKSRGSRMKCVYTRADKSTSDSCQINRNPSVFTIFQLILNQIKFILIQNQSENGKCNQISVDLKRIRRLPLKHTEKIFSESR